MMPLKFLLLLLWILLSSCFNEPELQRIEKWYLDSWEASINCSFVVDEGQEEQNHIIETLLGLEESGIFETELRLRSDGEMQILKNNVVALSGTWYNSDRDVFSLKSNDQSWDFEVVARTEDSIVLRGGYYRFDFFEDIVLKKF